MLLWPFLVTLISLGLSLVGTVSNAASALVRLESTKQQAAAHGISLAEAMSRPVGVSMQGNQRILDNPLRFDYEQAFNAHRALDGFNAIGTGLEMITFIVFPVLFFTYGCSVGVTDVRHRILKQRVTIEGPRSFVLGKAFVVTLTAIASVLTCAVVSVAVAPVVRALFLSEAAASFPLPLQDIGLGNFPVQIAFSVGTALLFGQLGFFIGLAGRFILAPCLLATALLLVAPFAGPFDPRNVLSTVAQHIFNFWGGFTPRALFPVSAEIGVLLMVVGLGAIVFVCCLVWSRRTKFA